jgi:hypothetical protein
MNSRSEAPIWQTWSEKWGSWNSWFQARVRRDIRKSRSGILSVRISTRPSVDYSTRELQQETFRAMEPG